MLLLKGRLLLFRLYFCIKLNNLSFENGNSECNNE